MILTYNSSETMLVQTKIRRTHLGIRYDLYVNDQYRATAYTAKEIEPLIDRIVANTPMQAV
jgi:hypothetical protein